MDPIERFAAIVRRPEEQVELDLACLALAAGADPRLEAAVWLTELERLAKGITDLDSLRHRLFVEHGFSGNAEDYYDPDNSLLHRVLERARGIPITLSVVTIEVGRRAGLALHGVGMPGHFLVGIEDGRSFMDPFNEGATLDFAGAEEAFRRSTGAGDDVAFGPDMLPVVGTHAILSRMLNNLRGIYTRRRELRNLEWTLRMKLELPDATAAEVRDLARVLTDQGRFLTGAEEMESMAERLPEHAAAFHSAAMQIRSHLN